MNLRVGTARATRSALLPSVLLAAALPAQAREIFVTDEKGNSVTVVDGGTLKVTATVPVGNRPRGIVISPDGKFLYVCAPTTTRSGSWTRRPPVVGDLPSGPDPSSSPSRPMARRSTSPTRTTTW